MDSPTLISIPYSHGTASKAAHLLSVLTSKNEPHPIYMLGCILGHIAMFKNQVNSSSSMSSMEARLFLIFSGSKSALDVEDFVKGVDGLVDGGIGDLSTTRKFEDRIQGVAFVTDERWSANTTFWFRDGPMTLNANQHHLGDGRTRSWSFFVEDSLKLLFNEVDQFRRSVEKFVKAGDVPQIFLGGLDDRYVELIESIATKLWLDKKYLCLVYGGEKDGGFLGLDVGSDWKHEESREEYVIGELGVDDSESIMKLSTVGYHPLYIKSLLTEPPFSNLTIALRAKSTNTLAAWGLTHSGFSFGLLSTVDGHRRRGLAKLCASVLSKRQYQFMKDSYGDVVGYGKMGPHAFVEIENVASLATMKGVGYVEVKGVVARWMGVTV
ncbi:hypothetical protein HDU76_013769 [Blyttiomyces sp. JEL0837]|nr:hypothetical protein HDU76_013769 [Blyttiomyces sp. JEL0837]